MQSGEELNQVFQQLWNTVFQPVSRKDAQCCAVHGATESDRAALMDGLTQRFREIPSPGAFLFRTTMKGAASIQAYWLSLYREMARQMTEDALLGAGAVPEAVPGLRKKLDWVLTPDATAASARKLRLMFDNWFIRLQEANVRVVLVIDDFDLARDLCTDGIFFMELFTLSKKGNSSSFHSVVLVSRGRIQDIEHSMSGGSSLSDAYPAIQV